MEPLQITIICRYNANMNNSTVQARVKPEVKRDAEEIFESMGIGTADAIRMFLKQTINVGGLPFTPISKIPNKTTVAALNKADEGDLTSYKTTKEVFSSWDK